MILDQFFTTRGIIRGAPFGRVLEDGHMRRVNSGAFYKLGQALKPLSKIQEGSRYQDVFGDLIDARTHIGQLLNNEVVPIRTSKNAAKALLAAIGNVIPEDFTEAVKDFAKRPALTSYDSWLITDALGKFEHVLIEELGILDTYSVSQKGVYSTSDLIENADKIVNQEFKAFFSPEGIIDIQQAGRCLAFNLPTAAAFHILRAVEAVIRQYYAAVVKSTQKSKSRNWGAYIKGLEECGADKKAIAVIRGIKDNYRNPIIHPEETVTLDEAIALFGISQGAIFTLGTAILAETTTSSQNPPA